MPVPWLHPQKVAFPPTHQALAEPNGLLAVGGDLSTDRLLAAYRLGIFPWFEDDQPILWWTPSPRAVLFTDQIHISKSLKKTIRKKRFTIKADQQFEAVIDACASPRQENEGTWITSEMRLAYIELAKKGHAHSVETYLDDQLVGGLYGICIGRIFFGESMFSTESDASKVAFVHLALRLKRFGFKLIDCQVHSQHLASLGANEIERSDFETILTRYIEERDYDSNALWDRIENWN